MSTIKIKTGSQVISVESDDAAGVPDQTVDMGPNTIDLQEDAQLPATNDNAEYDAEEEVDEPEKADVTANESFIDGILGFEDGENPDADADAAGDHTEPDGDEPNDDESGDDDGETTDEPVTPSDTDAGDGDGDGDADDGSGDGAGEVTEGDGTTTIDAGNVVITIDNKDEGGDNPDADADAAGDHAEPDGDEPNSDEPAPAEAAERANAKKAGKGKKTPVKGKRGACDGNAQNADDGGSQAIESFFDAFGIN